MVMFSAYFIVCVLIFVISLSVFYLRNKRIKSMNYFISFLSAFAGFCICFVLSAFGEIYTVSNINNYTWEPQYGTSHRVVIDSANNIDLIDYNGDVYYRFTIVNKDGLLEVINAPADLIEKVEICGVKSTYIPITKYKCVEPSKLVKWFGFTDVVIKEKRASGKLVLDEGTYIRSLTYKLIEE